MYYDSDYAGDPNDSRSTFGYVSELADGPVTWNSRKQSFDTQSTTEAEFIGNHGTRECAVCCLS